MKKEKSYFIICFIFVVIAGIFYQCKLNKTNQDEFFTEELKPSFISGNTSNPSSSQRAEANVSIVEATKKGGEGSCYVCGQVKTPGVYEFQEGERLDVLIRSAGGFTKKAAKESLNLAQYAVDGEKIYVPSLAEVQEENKACSDSQEPSLKNATEQKVNLNTASIEELTTLPGVGKKKAESIIAYREEQGSFGKIEDLKNVEGIKDGVFLKIKDFITV